MLPAMAEETELAARVRPDGDPPAPPEGGPKWVAPVVVPRWVQLVLLPLSIVALYIVARAAGTVLLIFVIAAVIALILNPVVSFVQRGRLPRALAVLAVYVAFFTTLAFAGFVLSGPVTDQARSFQRDVPRLVDQANGALHDVQVFFDDNGIDVEVERQGETALTTLQSRALEGSGEIVSLTGEILTRVVETGFHILLVVVLSIYMLIYGPVIGGIVRRDHAARRRDAGRRLPHPGPARRVQLRPRPAALQRPHGRERGPAHVGVRRAGHLRGRQPLRAGVRRVVRAHGARPVRRPGARRDPADHRRGVRGPPHRASGSASASWRSSSSRGTSWHRRSSGARCG